MVSNASISVGVTLLPTPKTSLGPRPELDTALQLDSSAVRVAARVVDTM